MKTTTTWRKPSGSTNSNTCVELAGDLRALRDSKNILGPTLWADVTELVKAVKGGQFG
jgi:hypothetical protein